MEILEYGDTYKTTTCPKCHAYLSYVSQDIEVINRLDDYYGGIHYYWAQTLKCPECGEKIILKEICD